jgi:DNA-binding MarR family transcriptional regulator
MKKERQTQLRNIMEQIAAVYKAASIRHEYECGSSKLTKSHVDVLFFLAKNKKSASIKEISSSLNVTPAAISQVADALVEKGLLKRDEDKNDRRILNITLSKKAHELFSKLKKDYFKSLESVFKNLSEKDIETLIQIFSKLEIPRGEKSCLKTDLAKEVKNKK